MRNARAGVVALLLVLSAGCATLLVLQDSAIGARARVAGQGRPRRRAQGSPPAPVPVLGAGSAVAPASAAGTRCFSAIPGNHILHEPPAAGACRPFVAVVAPCTSRKKNYKSVAGTPFVEKFFQTALQTLLKSDEVGYDVAFYVGYDAGDAVWDTDQARRDLPGLLQSLVDRHYKKSVLDGVKAMDFHANKHIPGVSIKTVSRSIAALLLTPRLGKLSRLLPPLRDSRSSAKARAWWRLPIA